MRNALVPRDWSLEQRFWHYTQKRKKKDCWPWTLKPISVGYGRLTWKRRTIRAHRLSWIVNFGPIPRGKCVLHSCDNRRCVNPNHLFLGDPTSNMKDRDAKGRQARGETSGNAVMTTSNVLALRASPLSLSKAAIKFGISKAQASKIRCRKSWAHSP